MTDSDAVQNVVHVFPTQPVPEDADPWQLLESGQAIAVERTNSLARRQGSVYPATSSMARALQPVLDLAESSGGNLFRVHLPTGASLNQLVPAVGGGYRGMVSGAGKGISGHARLVPATMSAAKAARVGVVAVAVAADYMAQQELLSKLDAIRRSVGRLEARFEADDQAILDVAEETIAEAQAAVAGDRTPPVSLGLDSTASSLRIFLARERAWIQGLTTAAEHIADLSEQGKLDPDGVPIDTFEELIGMDTLHAKPWKYAQKVANYYRALVLDSHLAVLAAAEAALSAEDVDLEAFQRTINRRLRRNALRQEELAEATQALTREPLTSKFMQRKLKEAHAVERVVTAVAFGVRTSARTPALVNAHGRQEMLVEVLKSGDIKVIAS